MHWYGWGVGESQKNPMIWIEVGEGFSQVSENLPQILEALKFLGFPELGLGRMSLLILKKCAEENSRLSKSKEREEGGKEFFSKNYKILRNQKSLEGVSFFKS